MIRDFNCFDNVLKLIEGCWLKGNVEKSWSNIIRGVVFYFYFYIILFKKLSFGGMFCYVFFCFGG